MDYPVIIPAGPVPPAVPRGAAVLREDPGRYLVCADMLEPFGERCALALRDGRAVPAEALPDAVTVGWFSTDTGEVRLDEPRGPRILGEWIGHQVYRDDLRAHGRPSVRGRHAQGRGEGRPGGVRGPGPGLWF